MDPPASLGNLVRLLPLQLSELPAHPALTKIDQNTEAINRGAQNHINETYLDGNNSSQRGDTDDSHRKQSSDDGGFPTGSQAQNEVTSTNIDRNGRPRLTSFVKEVLDQATSFVDDVLPATFAEDNERSSSPAVAKVRLLKRNIDGQQLSKIPWSASNVPRKARFPTGHQGEAWFARRSRHASHSQEGTAEFPEFEQGLMVDHSKHEQEYTPDVFDAYHVLDWDAETLATAFTVGESYSHIRMCSMRYLIRWAICIADQLSLTCSLRDVP